jgi:hypothetical protein
LKKSPSRIPDIERTPCRPRRSLLAHSLSSSSPYADGCLVPRPLPHAAAAALPPHHLYPCASFPSSTYTRRGCACKLMLKVQFFVDEATGASLGEMMLDLRAPLLGLLLRLVGGASFWGHGGLLPPPRARGPRVPPRPQMYSTGRAP